MNWTRKAPTVAGWYWWRRDQHALPGVAIACSDLSGYYMNRTGHNSTFDHVDDVIGEWLGPITPDSYQQGRVAGVQDVLESFKKHHDACNDFRHCECAGGFWYEHIGKAWMDEKAAQAAQDEKGVGDGGK